MATNIGKCLKTHSFTNAEFIESIGGSTNPNELIHRILFDMTSKRETVGMDVMRLGAALAVIRNNDGFNGLLNILDTLFNSVPARAKEACRKHDNATILASERNKKCEEETSEKKEMYIESKIDKLASKTGGYSKQKYLGTRSDVSNEEWIQASSDTEDECVGSEDSDLWNLWIWNSKIKRLS